MVQEFVKKEECVFDSSNESNNHETNINTCSSYLFEFPFLHGTYTNEKENGTNGTKTKNDH